MGTNYTVNTPEPGVGTPESAQGKSCLFCFSRCRGVYWWYPDIIHHVLLDDSGIAAREGKSR